MTPAPDLGAVLLVTPAGQPTSLEPFRGSWLVAQLVRYFGCLPCQEWLIELDRQRPRFEAHGATVVAIGGSADYQARWLMQERGVRMPLLLDPDQRVRDAIGLGDPLGWRMLDPRGVASYARTMTHGFRPQRITRDTVRSPGVVILDPGLVPRWQFVGRRIGDYPAHSSVESALGSLVQGT